MSQVSIGSKANEIETSESDLPGVIKHVTWSTDDGYLAQLTCLASKMNVALYAGALGRKGRGVGLASGPDIRTAATRAYHELRLSRHRNNIVHLLRQRRRLILALREARKSIVVMRCAIGAQSDLLAQRQRDTEEMAHLRAESEQIEALKAQIRELQERNDKLVVQNQELSFRLGALMARYATLQGRADDLAKQLGLYTSKDLARMSVVARKAPGLSGQGATSDPAVDAEAR